MSYLCMVLKNISNFDYPLMWFAFGIDVHDINRESTAAADFDKVKHQVILSEVSERQMP